MKFIVEYEASDAAVDLTEYGMEMMLKLALRDHFQNCGVGDIDREDFALDADGHVVLRVIEVIEE